MKRIIVYTLIWCGLFALRCGATVYHSDGSAASVQGLQNAVLSGDTITIPAGTFTWSVGINITKAINLQGAGVGSTIIKDNVQSGSLIGITLVANKVTRLTGIEFRDGGRANREIGILHVVGSNSNGSKFRLDHCKWYNLNGASLFDTVIGVVDHNTFVIDRTGLPINIYDSYWNGRTQGDGSWAAPTGFGTDRFLFIEDNMFTHSDASQKGVTDSYAGGRFVVRHNNIFNGLISNHGTESTGRTRGGRAMEVYNNSFTGTDLNRFVGGVRSGGVLFHDNSVSGYWGDSATFTLENFRNFFPFDPWGGADGTNPWDVNAPNAFFTGTVATNSANRTVTVSGVNWAQNHWAGYAIRRTSDVCNSGSVSFGEILSNTSNTITYADNGGYPTPPALSFCAGDSIEIRQVIHALDQPGRALGSLITGNPPARPAGWNNQATEPCYSWNNTTGNAQVNFSAGPGVRANEHYFNNIRMPGYTPYAYPHPLVTGDPTPTSTLGNISTRSFVQNGAAVMIGGFVIEGSGPKRVIVRAIGPELTRFGIPNALADPTLELHNGAGALIASNNNWQSTIIGGIITRNQVSAIQSSGHAPTQPSESAIIATLPPGNYTAIVHGVSNTTGVGLVEVYDLSTDTASVLGNISTRSLVQTGADVMIGGFIIEGSGPKTVIVRAIGPELTRFGVPNALADPTLELHNGAGALIASSNNWQSTIIGGIITSDQVSAIQNSGHAPTQPGESAIIATLQPGNYTAIVRGINNAVGVALVDLYDLH